MPTKQQIVADAVRIVQSAYYPGGFSAQLAWLGVYQALLWYEPVHACGFDLLPHIIDADKLRPTASRPGGERPLPWQARAKEFERYLAAHLGCPPEKVRDRVDGLMRLPAYAGLQRQNPLGIAFPGVIKYLLESCGNEAVEYELEVDATTVYPGISMPGRSERPMIDILARRSGCFPRGAPVAIISAKWSLRHDRINDITNECPIYKAAALRSRTPLKYYVVTNEFDPARLHKILSDTCVDGVVHVHKPAVVAVCRLDGRLERLLDLSELFPLTNMWA